MQRAVSFSAIALACAAMLCSHTDVNAAAASRSSAYGDYLSPSALAASPDGKTLYIAYHTARQIGFFDIGSSKVIKTIKVADQPTGLALSKDGTKLYVTCASPASPVQVINVGTGKIMDTMTAGHTAMSPVLSPDERTLYVCNRFHNSISVFNLATGKETVRIPVNRQPYACDLSRDGKFLFVANHIHNGRSSDDQVASTVSVIDLASGKVINDLPLPNGSGLLCDVKVSPDGKYACVTHLLARFHLPTTQLERGWMNTDAITVIDVNGQKIINTVLVDSVDSGGANPYALAWSSDSKTLFVTHAGTHELSIVDMPALISKLAKMPTSLTNGQTIDYTAASRIAADVPNDLSFLVGIRQRIKLNAHGPRSLAVVGSKVFTGNYYSDNLSLVDLAAPVVKASSLALGPEKPMTVLRKGDFYFNDASICFQGWQSCASCHSFDARVDGLNWDLLNDGIGNPKNSKSLLLSHKTPPSMSMGIRDNAETAVRSGIRHILFTVQPDEVPSSMDEWLKTLKPIPSPYLVNGKLSKSAERGRKLFNSPKVGCATCHPEGLFTTLKHYDVGTQGQYDKQAEFDTPTLLENWRTAPYLHDGTALTMRDVLTTSNKGDKHGKTSHLTPQEIEDLANYVLSQ